MKLAKLVDMPLTFSSEDVRNHLESLGYEDISERQLKDFVKDLRRLIQYEEKQKRLDKLKTIEEHPKSPQVRAYSSFRIVCRVCSNMKLHTLTINVGCGKRLDEIKCV